MTKLRRPLSLEDAVIRAAEIIGYQGMSEAAGRTESLCRKWGDPDLEATISVHQAVAVDQACFLASGITPFREYINFRLEVLGHNGQFVNITEAFLELSALTGKLADAIQEAKSDQSHGGCKITPNESKDLQRKLQTLRHQVDKMIAACEPDRNIGSQVNITPIRTAE